MRELLSKAVRILVLLGILFNSSCAHVYRFSTPLKNPAEYADIFVIRTKSLLGSAGDIDVLLDGYKTVGVNVGHFAHFRVDPGSHAIGCVSGGITLNFEGHKRYYFLIGISFQGSGTIERIDDVRGENLLAASKEIPLN